ncbi:MAG: hypothetical protein LBV43_09635 [Prevotella sp.]|jgi:hypothetical protein|nr:hypothetical protein [Prevotella sp.]
MKTILPFLLYFFSSSFFGSQNNNYAQEVGLERNSIIKSYPELKKEALDKRDYFRREYDLAGKNQQRQDSVINEATDYLLNVSDIFFKAWYNTPWTFHGHSKFPKEGSIACGYFITTTLQDMGFNIPRVKWAQQASEYLIKKLTSDIRRFQQKPIADIVNYIESKGEGLYIVGLDCHVGYIYYINGEMSFVHANYYKPKIGVMSEPLSGRNPLNDSKYRVVGKILSKEMIRNWILNIPYSE